MPRAGAESRWSRRGPVFLASAETEQDIPAAAARAEATARAWLDERG